MRQVRQMGRCNRPTRLWSIEVGRAGRQVDEVDKAGNSPDPE